MTQLTPEQVADGLCELERERLTGWQGPPGAAYNVISEGLQEMGLLTRAWELTGRGKAVAAALSARGVS